MKRTKRRMTVCTVLLVCNLVFIWGNSLLPAEVSGQISGTLKALLDGVSAMLMRLEMETYTELRTQKGMLEINFCVDGRFETHFSLRDQVLLKPGDMAISCYDGVHGSRSESRWATMREYALR